MTEKAHTTVILRAIRDAAGPNGIAWWRDVEPALAEYGLGFPAVAALRNAGLIEPSREIGMPRLTPAGLSRIS